MANQEPKNNTNRKESSEIFQAPTLLRQPMSRQVELDGKVLLRVVATGLPLPSFQWFHNGRKLVGATTSTLSLNHLRRMNGGAYHCEVSNFVGKVASQQAIISFRTERLPRLAIQPAEILAKEGQPITLKITSLSPSQVRDMKIHWTFDGKRIKGAHGLELKIGEAKKKYQGVYKALVSTGSTLEASNPTRVTVVSAGAALPAATPPPEPLFELPVASAAEDSFFFDPDKEEKEPIGLPMLDLAVPEQAIAPQAAQAEPNLPEPLLMEPEPLEPATEAAMDAMPAPPKKNLGRARDLLQRLQERFRKYGEEKSGLAPEESKGELPKSA